MTILYTNAADRTVSLDVPIKPSSDVVDISVLKDGELLYEPLQVQYVNDLLSFTLPFSLTQNDNKYDIHWQFFYTENGEAFEFDDYSQVQIVTPILPIRDIKQIMDTATDEEIYTVERAVCHIIQAHTGQFFGKYIGKKSITGNGDSFLRMPMRLISLNSVNGNTFWNNYLSLRGSGWFLRSNAVGVPSIRADSDGWHEGYDGYPVNAYSGQTPIVAPFTKHTIQFLENVEYEIDGVWGWNSVPTGVQEAAKLLINDYACGDSMYRDRFVTAISAADWRLEFHEGAFSNTGNVRANQLLAEFVLRRGWVVI